MLYRIASLLLVLLPLQGAVITQIQMSISANGGGPQSSCTYSGSGPSATCSVIGAYGSGQAQASADGTQINVGAGGNGAAAQVYVTSTLDALYETAYTGHLFALLDYQCSAGGTVASGWAGLTSTVCGTGTRPSSIDESVLIPVDARGGKIQVNVSWFAAVSTLGDQEYASSKLSLTGFQDAAGAPVMASIANASNATVPEPATWGLTLVSVVAFVTCRTTLRYAVRTRGTRASTPGSAGKFV